MLDLNPRKFLLPLVMGALMGLMMLKMLHGALTSTESTGGLALFVFVGAHVLVVAALLIGGLYAARSTGPVSRFLARLHRPSASHIIAMFAGMALSAAAAHLVIHGGLV